jgi:hypothetical protein
MGKPSNHVSEIDRLIELASGPKATPADEPKNAVRALAVEDPKNPPMWRLLLQMRTLLPYISKILPLVERGLLGTNISGQLAQHAVVNLDMSQVERRIGGVEEAQRDLNTIVKAQTVDIKILQEQVASMADSLEKNMRRQNEIAEQITGLEKLAKTWAVIVVVLLGMVVGLSLVVLERSLRGG